MKQRNKLTRIKQARQLRKRLQANHFRECPRCKEKAEKQLEHLERETEREDNNGLVDRS